MQTTNTNEVIQIGKKACRKVDMHCYVCEIDCEISILMVRIRMVSLYRRLVRRFALRISFQGAVVPEVCPERRQNREFSHILTMNERKRLTRLLSFLVQLERFWANLEAGNTQPFFIFTHRSLTAT